MPSSIDSKSQMETDLDRYRRFDSTFHNYITLVVQHPLFNACIIVTVVVNALTLALETDEALQATYGEIFESFDSIYLAIYTLEFLGKVYVEPTQYWKNWYNLFDFFVLVISFIQAQFVWSRKSEARLSALRVLRALRTLRLLRTISFIKGLQVLVVALIDTIRRWVINIIFLLLVVIFLFGIMGFYFFGDHELGDKENWGSLGKAMLTLFSYVTADGWTDLQDRLDEREFTGSRIYTIIFLLLGHFIFSNVFIGVIIMNISAATETDKRIRQMEREAVVKHKKDFMMMRQHNDVKQMLERQKVGNFTNFHEMVQEFERTLHHDDTLIVSDLSADLTWMETFLSTIDHMDDTMYRIQQLHFEMANLLTSCKERNLIDKDKFASTHTSRVT